MTEPLDRHLRRVTRINGCEVRPSFLRNGITGRLLSNTYDAVDPETGEVIATASADKSHDVADILIRAVYRYNCQIVLREQKGRCWYCSRHKPLEFDHIKTRAKGRDDRTSNLRGVCAALCGGCDFHRRRHGG